MKTINATIACAIYALSSAAAAQGPGVYLGGSLGYVDLGESLEDIRADFEDEETFTQTSVTGNIDDNDLGWKLFAGYNFNEYIGVEGSYVDLGKATLDLNVTSTVPDISPDPIDFTAMGDAEVSGFTLTAVGNYPVNRQFDIFARGGALFWDAEVRTRATLTGAGTEVIEVDEDGTDLTLGLGARYHYNDSISFRAEWEHFFDVSDDGNEINLFSLGIQLNF